jgi:hypothetical protein
VLGEREPGHLDVVRRGIGSGVAGAQLDGQRFPGPAEPVVSERGQWVEPECLLPRRRCLLFL